MIDHQSKIQNPQTPMQVAIIGGGITGLTAAWELQKAGTPYTLLEKSNRYGGKIQTDHVEGPDYTHFLIERAGDAFLAAQKPWAMDLAYELGLDAQIQPTNIVQPSVYVLKNGELVAVPAGLQLIIPTNRASFLASSLMSEEGKARVLAEETIDPSVDEGDESIADFVRRRLGDEAVELLAEPLLSGIYSARPEEQSLLATFPRYRELEQNYGSLMRGALAAAAERHRSSEQASTSRPARPQTAFISFTDGTEVLTKELAARLSGDLRLGTGVTLITAVAASVPPGHASSARVPYRNYAYKLQLDSGETITARNVIVTTPAASAARLLHTVAPVSAAQLKKLRVVSTGIVFLAYRRDEVAHPLNGFGVVIPRREKRSINAMTWMSTKFDGRAPPDHVLLRVFLGGARTPHMMAKDDGDVLAVAQTELRSLLGIDARPVLHRIYRWIDAQPQYDVGHVDRMNTINANLPPGLYLAGSPYGGVGIPDCVRQGQEVARKIVQS